MCWGIFSPQVKFLFVKSLHPEYFPEKPNRYPLMLPFRKIYLEGDWPYKDTPAVLVGGMRVRHKRSNTQLRQMPCFVPFFMPCIDRDTSGLEAPVFL